MTVAIAGRIPASFEIKSATLPLVALLLKSADLAAPAGGLAVRFGDIPDFFDHDPLVIDLTPLQAQGDAAIDFAGLLRLLRPYRVLPVAVKGSSRAQMEAALAVHMKGSDVSEAYKDVVDRFLGQDKPMRFIDVRKQGLLKRLFGGR